MQKSYLDFIKDRKVVSVNDVHIKLPVNLNDTIKETIKETPIYGNFNFVFNIEENLLDGKSFKKFFSNMMIPIFFRNEERCVLMEGEIKGDKLCIEMVAEKFNEGYYEYYKNLIIKAVAKLVSLKKSTDITSNLDNIIDEISNIDFTFTTDKTINTNTTEIHDKAKIVQFLYRKIMEVQPQNMLDRYTYLIKGGDDFVKDEINILRNLIKIKLI